MWQFLWTCLCTNLTRMYRKSIGLIYWLIYCKFHCSNLSIKTMGAFVVTIVNFCILQETSSIIKILEILLLHSSIFMVSFSKTPERNSLKTN